MAFAAETFLFAYIGLSAVTFSYDNSVGLALGAFVLCLIGRVLNIVPLSLIVNQFRTSKISFTMQFVLWFAGLRGIIAFALAVQCVCLRGVCVCVCVCVCVVCGVCECVYVYTPSLSPALPPSLSNSVPSHTAQRTGGGP
jgi:NhaP-type Na+/H+ or K+/H+ antiporter